MRYINVIVVIVGFWLFFVKAEAQPANSNYVKSLLYAGKSDTITSIQYFDGFGRPSLQVSNGLSGNGKYTYSLQTYDLIGRENRLYFPESENFLCDSYPRKTTANHSTRTFDMLDRIISFNMGGSEWTGKNCEMEYLINKPSEVLIYRISDVINGRSPSEYWPAGSLDVESRKDEDGHDFTIYKDVLGNIVLEKNSGYPTYYVYDEIGLLRYVLPPAYQNTNRIEDAYIYNYDDRQRLISKKYPGCDPVEYVHDSNNRVIYYRDGLLKEKGLYSRPLKTQ